MQRLRSMETALEEQKHEAEVVEESLQEEAHAMRQEYEEHPYLFGGLWDAGDSPNVDALCFDHTDEDAL